MGLTPRVLLLTTLAGAAMPIGAALACFENIRPKWLEQELRHSVIAFGGGVLLAAVALVLVPDGAEKLPHWAALLSFAVGGLLFMGLTVWLDQSDTSASQLVAMLADFLPESVAMGAAFATAGSAGLLLALLIALQNLPEGFNAYREIKASSNWSKKKLLWAFVALVPLGPIAGLLGLHVFSHMPTIVGALMLAAAGGILYLTFQSIAPQAKLQKAWAPPMGAVLGFALGLLGHLLTG